MLHIPVSRTLLKTKFCGGKMDRKWTAWQKDDANFSFFFFKCRPFFYLHSARLFGSVTHRRWCILEVLAPLSAFTALKWVRLWSHIPKFCDKFGRWLHSGICNREGAVAQLQRRDNYSLKVDISQWWDSGWPVRGGNDVITKSGNRWDDGSQNRQQQFWLNNKWTSPDTSRPY